MNISIENDVELQVLRNRIINFIKKFNIKPNVVLFPLKYKYGKNQALVDKVSKKYKIIYSNDVDTILPFLSHPDMIRDDDDDIPF